MSSGNVSNCECLSLTRLVPLNSCSCKTLKNTAASGINGLTGPFQSLRTFIRKMATYSSYHAVFGRLSVGVRSLTGHNHRNRDTWFSEGGRVKYLMRKVLLQATLPHHPRVAFAGQGFPNRRRSQRGSLALSLSAFNSTARPPEWLPG